MTVEERRLKMYYFKSLIVIIFIILFISGSMAKAEPTSNIQYLIEDSVSMLDWGLSKIDRDLEPVLNYPIELGFNSDTIIGSSINYDLEKNRIVIDVYISKATSQDQAILWCKKIVGLIKTRLNVDNDTGKPFLEATGALYPYFSHQGYKDKSEPKGLYKELDNIAVINIRVETEASKTVKCEAPLLGTKIIFQ
jgi:hypothetical protein